jgi:hypothetical protein
MRGSEGHQVAGETDPGVMMRSLLNVEVCREDLDPLWNLKVDEVDDDID